MSFYNSNGGGFLSSIPTAVKNIIIINVLVMIMTWLNEPLMTRLFALNPVSFIYKPWQLVTYMFMQANVVPLYQSPPVLHRGQF